MCTIHPPDDLTGWVFEIHLLQIAGISVIAEFKTIPRKKLADLSFLDTKVPRFADFCQGLYAAFFAVVRVFLAYHRRIDIVEKMGGLHKFMAWNGPILTDSGGYQVFSLAGLRRVSDEGVIFRSHIDGSEHTFTPELAVQYQESLGADIIMVLDECTATDDVNRAEQALRRTHHWAERCLKAKRRRDQALFGIVQGGIFPELRRRSVEFLSSLEFPGYAIGGLSIGEPKQLTLTMTEETAVLLPEDKPRYLMGVGSPEDLVECVARGIDIFDSALPTRVARNGALYTPSGRVNILNAAFAEEQRPLDPACNCYTCRTFSAAYLHHLFKARELLAYRLATIHNLTFISNLMQRMRAAILDGTFPSFRADFMAGYRPTDEGTRHDQKQRWLQSRDAMNQ